MGRDDAKPVRDLQGGRAPAKAFAAFMRVAVAKRKIEQFDTKVTLPEWQLETEEEVYFGDPDQGKFVDENGDPVGTAPAPPPRPAVEEPRFDEEMLDQVPPRAEGTPEP